MENINSQLSYLKQHVKNLYGHLHDSLDMHKDLVNTCNGIEYNLELEIHSFQYSLADSSRRIYAFAIGIFSCAIIVGIGLMCGGIIPLGAVLFSFSAVLIIPCSIKTSNYVKELDFLKKHPVIRNGFPPLNLSLVKS